MITRILTAVVGLPLLIWIVYLGGLPLGIGVCIISLVGMYEFYKAVDGKIMPIHIVGIIAELIFMGRKILLNYALYDKNIGLADFLAEDGIFCAAYLILFVALLCFAVFKHNKYSVNEVCHTIFGFSYVGVLLSLVYTVRETDLLYLWLIFIFAFVSDTGAYFVGRAIGKHKLAPVLSPKKSVEGAVGGAVLTGIVTAVYAYFVFNLGSAFLLALWFVIGCVGSVFGQLGDLTASAIKRTVGIKDYGKLFPGHGGVLDRFDSVLFTSAFVYVCLTLLKLFSLA